MHFINIIALGLFSLAQGSFLPEDLFQSNNFYEIMNRGTTDPQVSAIVWEDIEFMKYVYFTLGAVVGASVESSGNI